MPAARSGFAGRRGIVCSCLLESGKLDDGLSPGPRREFVRGQLLSAPAAVGSPQSVNRGACDMSVLARWHLLGLWLCHAGVRALIRAYPTSIPRDE